MPRMVGASKPPTKIELDPAPSGSAWQPLPAATSPQVSGPWPPPPGGFTPPWFSKKSLNPSAACAVS